MDVKRMLKHCTFYSVFLGIFLSLNIACKDKLKSKRPTNLLSKDTMAQVLAEIHLLEASLGIKIFEDKKINQTRNLIKNKIYNNYGISKAQFFFSYNYYAEHPAAIDSIYINVITEISKRQAEMQKK